MYQTFNRYIKGSVSIVYRNFEVERRTLEISYSSIEVSSYDRSVLLLSV